MRHATYLTRTPSPVDISLLAICLGESPLDRCETYPHSAFYSAPMPKKPQVYLPNIANWKSPRARLNGQQRSVRGILSADTFLTSIQLWCRHLDSTRRA